MPKNSSVGTENDLAPDLKDVLEYVSSLLPAQGPINVFIHHNTLHAFEDQPFEEAVVDASQRFGCEPYLSEHTYRAELRRGRIEQHDLDSVLEQELGDLGPDYSVAGVSRTTIWKRILEYGYPDVCGEPLNWLLHETDVLTRFRRDLPGDARETLFPDAQPERRRKEEAALVGELWLATVRAMAESPRPSRPTAPGYVRLRDLLYDICDFDSDESIHPTLIRFAGAYLDQGLAHHPIPKRDQGMYECFIDLYGDPLVRLCAPWGVDLARMVAADRSQRRDAWASLRYSLSELGIPTREWREFLAAEALALRGWAGMVHQCEKRPDRVPVSAMQARLIDFLAARLLLTRAAVTFATRTARIDVPLAAVRETLSARLPKSLDLSAVERAWPVFHVAQLCGLDATAVSALRESDIAALELEIVAFDAVTRRRLFHLAYERHLRHRLYDALGQHEASPTVSRPVFQAIFCLDEREESFRRHLEESEPAVETFGTAGHFGVAMYFRGTTDAHPRALCPVSIQPQHYVFESYDQGRAPARWHRTQQRLVGLVGKNIHIGSRTLSRGAVIMATFGVFWIIPLVLRVILPWYGRHNPYIAGVLSRFPKSRLHLDRGSEAPPVGRQTGFTVDEMAEIVHSQLTQIGIVGHFAPLVFVLGHGSASLNNPQESAHDCGACGGGRGGPNARAFAQMANDPRVRAQLSNRGTHIPDVTWFLGGQRNTANNDVVFFDEDIVPEYNRDLLRRAKASFESARRWEAHERCRRFDAFPSWLPARAALAHVQARATDLAQPRPEYGHASNAFCVIGRRARSRGLFMDRRSFLVSYDPHSDPEGANLAKVLASVVPVVSGINLEYFFGYTDPIGYGCGTKLPHNVTCLLGVMDGAQSDLRTGLPWQMLEIHEPVRLTVVVETTPDILLCVLHGNADLCRLVQNRWLFFAALDPEKKSLIEIDETLHQRPYVCEHPLKTLTGRSLAHYRGRRGHIPFAGINATSPRVPGNAS